MTPPPGWYPDPTAAHLERWWDGRAWTEHRRHREAPTAPLAHQVPPQPPAFPAQPVAHPQQPLTTPQPAASSGRARAVALTVAGAVLVAAIVTGAFVLRGGDDGDPTAGTTPHPAPTASPPTDEPSTPPPSTASPTGDPRVVVDQLNGITLTMPDGWVKPEFVSDDTVVMTTDGTYDCPGDPGMCRHGLVTTHTATSTEETSPKALAEADISEAAGLAFDQDTLNRRPFGGMTGHQTVAQGPVAVAGRAGYYVRWQVTTAKGPGGYVQSLVFPSSMGTEAPVVVRYVFDAGQDGPPLADMDRITRGIRPVGDAATGGGVGSSIGPTP
ncbi:hypothetical protein C3489_14735 [Streptomyces sp. Ru71]|nr:DUF2510 domain-containing protein [Streptomyces sp. Ru71]POX54043.1 hypothetical protein C3489_14735 [Streptomyces sp. Ru71]